jgi:hypothetical protein
MVGSIMAVHLPSAALVVLVLAGVVSLGSRESVASYSQELVGEEAVEVEQCPIYCWHLQLPLLAS